MREEERLVRVEAITDDQERNGGGGDVEVVVEGK